MLSEINGLMRLSTPMAEDIFLLFSSINYVLSTQGVRQLTVPVIWLL